MQKVTINVVAEQAGVSKKTVSRVLNNESSVSEATRKKVILVSKELGYKPNPFARGLASNCSYILGLLYDNPNTHYINSNQVGALDICQKNGYHLLIHPCKARGNEMLNSLQEIFNHSRLDGLMLTPPFSDFSQLLDFLDEKKIPHVRIGATINFKRSCCVISNDFNAAEEMTRYLITLGHRRIGFIQGHPQHNSTQQRFAGYKKALQDAQISLDEELVEQGEYNFESGERCASKLLKMKDRPSAIFASNDYMAAGVMKVASQMYIPIPHELSLTGFDNAPIAQYLWPSLTTIKQPVEEMAATATSLLLQQISNPTEAFSKVVMDSHLLVRESTVLAR